ncbi:MAG: c-type cytochrome [Polyangiales bacterium]
MSETRHEGRQVHVYDGIEEEDNALPRWWLITLWGAVLFAAVYWQAVHDFNLIDTPTAAYEKSEEARHAAEADQAKQAGEVTVASMLALSKDSGTIKEGAETFKSTCSACHRADGGGLIGPNLTDGFWLHGGAPNQIYKTVRDGEPAKGMPPWGASLGEQRVRAVAAHVLTLKNTNVRGGKAPQGEAAP